MEDDLTSLYTSFNGRIDRAAYWFGTIFLVLVALMIFLGVGALLGVSIMAPDFRFRLIGLVLGALVIYASVALMVKRLHDRDRPAWLVGLFLAPSLIKTVTDLIGVTGNPLAFNILDLLLFALTVVAEIWAFVELGCLRGTVGTNQHGPDPLMTHAIALS
jgi:uncharacterized membrane protein YhaH (DUF805 family)